MTFVTSRKGGVAWATRPPLLRAHQPPTKCHEAGASQRSPSRSHLCVSVPWGPAQSPSCRWQGAEVARSGGVQGHQGHCCPDPGRRPCAERAPQMAGASPRPQPPTPCWEPAARTWLLAGHTSSGPAVSAGRSTRSALTSSTGSSTPRIRPPTVCAPGGGATSPRPLGPVPTGPAPCLWDSGNRPPHPLLLDRAPTHPQPAVPRPSPSWLQHSGAPVNAVALCGPFLPQDHVPGPHPSPQAASSQGQWHWLSLPL